MIYRNNSIMLYFLIFYINNCLIKKKMARALLTQDISRVITSENIDNNRGTYHFYNHHPFNDEYRRKVTAARQNIQLSQSGRLLASYLRYHKIYQDNTDSYENFLETQMQKIMDSYPLIFYNKRGNPVKKFRIVITEIKMPQLAVGNDRIIPLTPEYAMTADRSITNSVMCVVQEFSFENGNWNLIDTSEQIQLCNVPTIIRSKYCNSGNKTNRELYEEGYCPSWPGGYVISQGEMKTLDIKQKLRNNRFIIYPEKKMPFGSCSMICTSGQGTIKVSAFVPSDERPICIWLKFMGYKEENGVPREINMFYTFVLLQQFVFPDDDDVGNIIDDILKFIPNPEARQKGKIILDFALYTFQYEAETPSIAIQQLSEFIGLPKNEAVENRKLLLQYLKEHLFPHMNDLPGMSDEEILMNKYYQLCYMVAEYLQYINGYRPEDDRNSVSNSIFMTAGMTIGSLFNTIIQFLHNEFYGVYKNNPNDITMDKIVSWVGKIDNTASFTYEHSIKSMAWGYKRNKTVNKSPGVERLIPNSITLLYAEITKIIVPSSKKGRQTKVRENHQSQTGFIDYVDSPESDACGLTKRKALTCYFSQERDDGYILEMLKGKYDSLEDDDQEMIDSSDILIVNGKLLGFCDGPKVTKFLRDKRLKGEIAFDTMICYRGREVLVSTDGGRATRPLLVVNEKTGNLVYFEKNLIDKPFEEILKAQAVEFVDAMEQEGLFICQSMDMFVKNRYSDNPKKFTHCELDPNAILSFASAEVPLSNHNMGTKNCYSCNMMKQALGTIGSNYSNVFNSGAKMFDTAAEPIMDSQMNVISGLNQLPTGRNVTVCFMAYNGYNQEDAIIINEGSINRGVFNYTVYYKYKFSIMATGSTKLVLKGVDDEDRKNPKYRHLDNTGIVKIGAIVNPGDVLIRVEQKVNNNGIEEVQEKNLEVRYGERGIVYDIVRVGNIIKIKIEDPRNVLTGINFVGDKFSSRAATKGVASIVIPEHEIPFSTTGLRPDIIINPLGVPTRAPVNKLIEILTTKGSVLKGEFINGTTFNNPEPAIERSKGYLREYGYDEFGEEVMINPYNGKPFNGTFFMGIVDILMLTHHAIDKIQGQGKNIQREITTGQPIKGRKRRGGIRFGEWERDGQLAYSLSTLIYAIMCRGSDEKTCIICSDCGTRSIFDINDTSSCIQCKGNNLHLATIGGGFNLFRQYLSGLGIRTILNIEQADRPPAVTDVAKEEKEEAEK